ncbi:MAG: DUF393 domain-containing protein [Planctomycetes bacterium]|nr:DUF393 domain-containing protein [Planctomycetota bacterium]
MSDAETANRLVVLHDGDCSFCTGWVRRLARWDRHDRLRFCPLGSARGRALAARIGLDPDRPSTVIAVRGFEGADEDAARRSAAVLRIAAELGGWFRLALVGRIVPGFLRDALYDLVARHRHALGGAETCVLRDPELDRRLLR